MDIIKLADHSDETGHRSVIGMLEEVMGMEETRDAIRAVCIVQHRDGAFEMFMAGPGDGVTFVGLVELGKMSLMPVDAPETL